MFRRPKKVDLDVEVLVTDEGGIKIGMYCTESYMPQSELDTLLSHICSLLTAL
jgi:hypothetical protein